MKMSRPGLSLLFFVLSTSPMFGVGTVVITEFSPVILYYTWQEAVDYCRRYHSDLAFIQSENDKEKINIVSYFSWIGLTRRSSISSADSSNPRSTELPGSSSSADSSSMELSGSTSSADSSNSSSTELPGSTSSAESVTTAVPNLWMWNNNEKLNAATWAPGQPRNTDKCAFLIHNNTELYGSPCEAFFFFYCSKGGRFNLITESKTFKGAREYCNQQNERMAMFSGSFDFTSVHSYEIPVWVHKIWDVSEPDSKDTCTTLNSEKKTISRRNCSHHLPFVCMDDNIRLIKQRKSWEEAMRHCRSLGLSASKSSRYELVSVHAKKDDSIMRRKVLKANTEQVWVGLRFLAGEWFWMNKVQMTYPDLPICPLPENHCGVVSKITEGVQTANCSEEKNFLCYQLGPVNEEESN